MFAKIRTSRLYPFGNNDGTALLEGDVAEFKNCTVGVSTLKSVNIVNTIGVIYPYKDDWSLLERDYELLKSMLTQKYGEPADVTERIPGAYATNQT